MIDLSATASEPVLAPVRFGVIGAGWFACRRHLPDMQKTEGAELTAICRRDEAARNKVAHHFGIAPEHAYADWKELLERETLDAVLIATPNAHHYAQAKAALEHGLHVLVEKPLTIHGAEARELRDLAASRGLLLAAALNPPYWAHCHRIRQAILDGQMGEIESVSIYWSGTADHLFGRSEMPESLPGIVPPTLYRSNPTLNGGGYFMDGGSHLISELLWVTGLRVRRVSALMDAVPMDMRAVINLELENGAVATVNTIGDSRLGDRRARCVFGGSQGTAYVNDFTFQTDLRLNGHEPYSFSEASLPPISGPVANMVHAIQGSEPIRSNADHGTQVAEVVEAAYQSAESGRVITIEL